MHIENEQSSPRLPGRKPKVGPGQQVATNRAMHCNMYLVDDGEGGYNAVVDRIDKPTLVRGEYIPIGNKFHYPKQWGRKYAATKLIEYITADKLKQIELAQAELSKLQKCMDKVVLWSDTDE